MYINSLQCQCLFQNIQWPQRFDFCKNQHSSLYCSARFEEQSGDSLKDKFKQQKLKNDPKKAWKCERDLEKLTKQIGDKFAPNKDEGILLHKTNE